MNRKGNLIVVSGPSGAGKDTVVGRLFEIHNGDDIHLSVSATTRSPRPGEVDGVSYYFLTKEAFEQKVSDGGFIEWATFCDNMYGTLRDKVCDHLENGIDVILVIEVQGAMQVKKMYPDATLVFLLCPSFEEQKQRLINRNTEAVDVIEQRIATARKEVEYADNYDYVIINHDINESARELDSIIISERLKIKNNIKIIEEVRKS